MKSMKTVMIDTSTGEIVEVNDGREEKIHSILREAEGTDLEKAVAQLLYMLNWLHQSNQMSPGCFETLVGGLSTVCGSIPELVPKRLDALVGLFEKISSVANGDLAQ